MSNTFDTYSQDDSEHFLVAIDKAYSKEISNCSPSSDNGFNEFKKNKICSEPIKSKLYNAFIKVPELLQWAVLLLGPNVPFTCTVRNFIDDLCNDVECMIIRNKGVNIHWSSMEDGISTIPFLLTAITKQISHQAEVNNLYSESVNNPQLILCIIPNEGAEDYIEEIRRICKKIKITVVFTNCSDIANSSSEFRNSLGEEMKEKLTQFLIEQSQEKYNKKLEDDIPNIPKQTKQFPSNKYLNGNNSNNQNNDQDNKYNFNELNSPKYKYSQSCNGNFESSPNSAITPKSNYISPLNIGNTLSRSYQYNSPGRVERDRYYHNNYYDENSNSPGWNSSKPIYFSKSTNSPSQANASYSSRNNSFSVSPSPHLSIPRIERENTFSLRNHSYFNGQYSGSSPINVDKKNHYNNDINHNTTNNSDLMFVSENDNTSKNNKHSRSNTICNGVISSQKEAINTPRKFSGSTYSKSFSNNNNNNNNYNSSKLGIRNKFVNNNNNKRLSVSNNTGYNEYQYTNPYLEGLNLERNFKNNSNWEGRSNNNNSYNNKDNYLMESKSYSYTDNKSKNSKFLKKNNIQDSSSNSSSPTKNLFEIKSNKYDRKYDIDEEINSTKDFNNERDEFNDMNELKISRSFDKENSKNDAVPKYRPPIPPYNDKDGKIENDEMKIFPASSSYGKINNDNLSKSVPTKNFFDVRNNKKSNEINDWNKSNKSIFKYNKYNNINSKSKTNNNYYDDNDLDEISENKKNKKELAYNSTKSSPTRLTISISSNMKYRAPTPKNIMEGKYKAISPDSYYNELTKNNDTRDDGLKLNYIPKKEKKSPNSNSNSSNDINKLNVSNIKLTQSPSSAKVPSIEKYVPPNLRNQNKNGNNSNNSTPNLKSSSFDKSISSPSLIINSDDKLINNKLSKPINSSLRIQSELTKEIQAQQELTRNKSPLAMPGLSSNINNFNVIENKNNVISNNNSLLFNSRRHTTNIKTNLNNYNQVNDESMGNVYTTPNSINKYYINSVNTFDNSANYTDNNSDSLTNYYRTYK